MGSKCSSSLMHLNIGPDRSCNWVGGKDGVQTDSRQAGGQTDGEICYAGRCKRDNV